ncbi:MAG: hypothetical protein WCC21_13770, partial [Candidatus Acidiferrales bacterium]
RSRPAAAHAVGARTPAPRRTASPGQGSSVHFNVATNSFESSNGTPVSFEQLLNPVPGLGFDYHHLSVINQDLGIKALIDPATEWKIAEARRVLHGSRFSGPGFYIFDGGSYYPVSDDSSDATVQTADSDPSAQQQPQVIVVQAPPSQQADENSSTPEPFEEPIPDVGQFTLVLRNGRQLEAVAFSHVNDEIIYITTDGSRRSFPATDLNSDATVQINVERGTPLQLPL